MTQAAAALSVFARRRYLGIVTGASSSLVARGLAVAMSLLAVHFALPYLGSAKFGAWAVITTLQLWLQLSDFGLPAGMNNPLATLLARDDTRGARRLVFTTILLAAAAGVVVFSVVLGWVLLDGPGQFGGDALANRADDFDRALLVGTALTLAALPNAVITRVFTLQHRAYVSNVWLAIGQALAIVALVLSARWQLGLAELTALTTGAVTLSSFCCVATFFWTQPSFRPRREDFAPELIRSLMPVSLSYTALQLAGMLLLNSAIFIVAAALSPAAAAVFAATSRLTGICTLVAQLASPYFWASYSDALMRGEVRWLRQAFGRHLAASIGSTLLLGIFLVALGPEIIRWWSAGAIVADTALLYWLLAWQLVIATMNPIGALLLAHELYRVQTAASLVAGVLGAAIGWFVAPHFGSAGVIAAVTICYLLFVAGPVAQQTRRVLRPA